MLSALLGFADKKPLCQGNDRRLFLFKGEKNSFKSYCVILQTVKIQIINDGASTTTFSVIRLLYLQFVMSAVLCI